MTIHLRRSTYNELDPISQMEKQPHARTFVDPIPLASHQELFRNQEVEYLSIVNAQGRLAGYFILVSEAEGQSVEFRRILIDANERGIGQSAIAQMERYCREALGAQRIWLDVYDDNALGKHIYEKLGYKRFKSEARGDRLLHFYEKSF